MIGLARCHNTETKLCKFGAIPNNCSHGSIGHLSTKIEYVSEFRAALRDGYEACFGDAYMDLLVEWVSWEDTEFF